MIYFPEEACRVHGCWIGLGIMGAPRGIGAE